MSASVVLTCLFAFQQLHVGPEPASVGQEMVVTATQLQQPKPGPGIAALPVQVAAAGIEIALELPDRSVRALGNTGSDGLLRFPADVAGSLAVSATIDGVRCVPAFVVAPARSRWLLGIVSIPLGLALLWLQVRRLIASRRGAGSASVHS